jgi:hypothetical protein
LSQDLIPVRCVTVAEPVRLHTRRDRPFVTVAFPSHSDQKSRLDAIVLIIDSVSMKVGHLGITLVTLILENCK